MYVQGKNRIFYQAIDLDNVDVYCDFLNPNLERSKQYKMNYIEENTYYVDVLFKYSGSYIVRVFFGGKKINHNIIQVGSESGLTIYPDDCKKV